MVAPILLAVGSKALSNPAVMKVAIGGAIAAPVALIVGVAMIAGSLSGSFGGGAAAGADAAMQKYCRESAQGTQTVPGTGTYSETPGQQGQGGLFLVKFLRDHGLTYYQARIAWAIGMRESQATNFAEGVTSVNGVPFNGVAYGIWQIHVSAHKTIERQMKWSMQEVGLDPEKNFAVLMRFSRHLKVPTAWGLAANQPSNGAKFDWTHGYASWTEAQKRKSEKDYLTFYNQFPSAVKQAGISFLGGPAPAPVPSAHPSTQAPAPHSSASRPTASPSPSTVYGTDGPRPAPPVSQDPLGGLWPTPFAPGKAGVVALTSTSQAAMIRTENVGVPPHGSLTVEGHPGIWDPNQLETFTVAKYSYTVARTYMPTFRAFLSDWQASPYLGGGRYDLSGGPDVAHGSYVWRWARMASKLSDHAGYAVDVRTDVLPQVPFVRHMNAQETAAVHALLARYPDLGWGGDYSGKYIDEMHIYVRGSASESSVAQYVLPTLIVTDDSLDVLLAENDGALAEALTRFPYDVDAHAGRTVPEGVTALEGNAKTADANAVVVSLGAAEVQVGKQSPASTRAPDPGAASPSPSAVKLLDPALMDGWIADVMGAVGDKTVIWVVPTVAGPSRQIVVDALARADGEYTNLSLVTLPIDTASGFVTADGSLTKKGQEEMSGLIATRIADSQPLYTAKEECQDMLFSTPSEAVLTGEYRDRADVVISGGAEAAALAETWTGTTRANCSTGGRCEGQCDHLAARLRGVNRSGYESAASHWRRTLDPSGQWGTAHPGDKMIPVGALVFFDTGREPGHVATYVGGGYVISNWVGPDGKAVYKVPLKDMAASAKYLGWADPVFPGPE